VQNHNCNESTNSEGLSIIEVSSEGFIITSLIKLTDLAITEHVTGDIICVVMTIRVLGQVIHHERRHRDLSTSEKSDVRHFDDKIETTKLRTRR
jgi:hypothetical protein